MIVCNAESYQSAYVKDYLVNKSIEQVQLMIKLHANEDQETFDY